jgi:peptide chain release factor 2
MKVIRSKKSWTDAFEQVDSAYGDLETLHEFLEMGEGTEAEVNAAYQNTSELTEDLEMKKMLSSEEDQLSAMLQITPGAGGTESNDWAGILMRMYIMWGEANGYKVKEVDFQAGDVAGVKSVTLEFDGPLAYGFLKSENGVHRLVRISPFDSGGRRAHFFASVYVYPVADDTIEIDINPNDVELQTSRSGGQVVRMSTKLKRKYS